MSRAHPIVAVTGASGAGTTSVQKTFKSICAQEKYHACFVEGDSFHKYDRDAMRQANIAETPLRIEAGPELISKSILFLASDLSSHLTGQLITSDGGYLLGVYQEMFDEPYDRESL